MKQPSVVCLGCAVVCLAAGCHLHLWGRYDCREGAVQEQRQGGDLIDDLLREAAQENTDDETPEN